MYAIRHWMFCYFQKDSVLSVSQASHQLIFIKERLLTPIITQSSINRLKDGEGHPPGDLGKSRIKPWGERTHRKGRRYWKLLFVTGLFLFWFMYVCEPVCYRGSYLCWCMCKVWEDESRVGDRNSAAARQKETNQPFTAWTEVVR